MKTILVLLGLCSTVMLHAQQTVKVHFNPLFEGASLGLNQTVSTPGGEDYFLEHHKFYFSRIAIVHDGGQILHLDTNLVFLVDIVNPWVDLGALNVSVIEGIHFGVGVPQYLNHSDINQFPEEHPLSYQSPSMFWGWSAGYMHMIIGGRYDSNNDGSPETTFELHNLGDENYYSKAILLPATSYPNDVQLLTINWNVNEWMNGITPSVVEISHSSIGANATIMFNVVDSDVFTAPQNAGVSTFETKDLIVYYQENKIQVILPDAGLYHYELFGADGKIVQTASGLSQTFQLEPEKAGAYILQVSNSKGERVSKTVLMS